MKVLSKMGCDTARELMSPFIDSMVTPEEADGLQSHIADCEPCARQLQSFISLRTLLAGVEPAPVPEDLQLETRVKLSKQRLPNDRERWQACLDNILKPLAVPAVLGVALTALGFVILFFGLLSPRPVQAKNDAPKNAADRESVSLAYQPPVTTGPTVKRFSWTMSPELEQVSVQTDLSDRGQVVDYKVISGARSAGVDSWLQEVLLLAQFRPATSWGNPVPSRVILSFVNVRG